MEVQNKSYIKLVLGFQYLGPEHGAVPHLDLNVVDKNGKEYYCRDYVFAHEVGEVSNEEFKKVIEKSKELEKYSKGDIKVGHFGVRDNLDYVSRIMIRFENFMHDSYSDMIATFSKCLADIYYDFNGRRIGFTNDNEEKLPIKIQLDKKVIEVPNPIDSKDARNVLASNVGKTIGYIIAEYNNRKVNDISEHRSPRR